MSHPSTSLSPLNGPLYFHIYKQEKDAVISPFHIMPVPRLPPFLQLCKWLKHEDGPAGMCPCFLPTNIITHPSGVLVCVCLSARPDLSRLHIKCTPLRSLPTKEAYPIDLLHGYEAKAQLPNPDASPDHDLYSGVLHLFILPVFLPKHGPLLVSPRRLNLFEKLRRDRRDVFPLAFSVHTAKPCTVAHQHVCHAWEGER